MVASFNVDGGNAQVASGVNIPENAILMITVVNGTTTFYINGAFIASGSTTKTTHAFFANTALASGTFQVDQIQL